MRKIFQRYRRGVIGVGAVLGASMISLTMAIPANAESNGGPTGGNVGASNTVILEGGSQTVYQVLQELSNIYNSAPGCNMVAAQKAQQELNYSCASSTVGGSGPGYEEGYSLDTTSGGSYLPLNPYNDVVAEEAPYGSSNGILSLEDQVNQPSSCPGTGTNDADCSVSPISLARASRSCANNPDSPSSDDYEGLNCVAFAEDAVPWLYFNKPAGLTAHQETGCDITRNPNASAATPSGETLAAYDMSFTTPADNLDQPSPAQLEDIYTGADKYWIELMPAADQTNDPYYAYWNSSLDEFTSGPGSDKGPTSTTNDPAVDALDGIYVFMAQSGSGTESTWASDLGLTSGTYPYAGVTAGADSAIPAADLISGAADNPADFEIFENEVSDIYSAQNDVKSADQVDYPILCNSIFYFSYGKYSILCPSNECAGTPSGNAGTTTGLGLINGFEAIPCDITDTCTGTKKEKHYPAGTTYFTDRQLFQDYSNCSNTNLPYACAADSKLPPFESQAIQNFASSYGFLCNPAEADDIDPTSPQSGVPGATPDETYHAEIDAIISANGFFPIPEQVMGDSALDYPPDPSQAGYDANYAAAEPTPSGDMGYCLISTTDGDGNVGNS